MFKELNINNCSYSKLINEEIFVKDSKQFNNFFLLLNKPLIRQLAYNILQPLIKEIANVPSHSESIKNHSPEYQTLKKYIKKFKYFYRLFFLERLWLNKYQITEKELNYYAIKFLFILAGI